MASAGRNRWWVGIATMSVVVVAALGPWSSSAGAAGGLLVSGRVFWDQNNNGTADLGEPGVAGIRVHLNAGAGTPTTVTAPDGTYTLAGLPTGGSGSIVVETGWFRSQCAALSCPPGPGPDNDFRTANQFIQLPMSTVTQSLVGIDVGLLPDWPGHTSAAPAPQAGVTPANAVDVASRLSWATSSCSDGKYFICRPGDTYTVTSQFLNQGTTAITGLRAVLALPTGDHVATGDVTRDFTLNATATSPGITSLTPGPLTAAGTVLMTFTGTLVPGGLVKVSSKLVAGGTVGTPGCVRGAPTTICPTGEPFGAPLVLAVTHTDQAGDPDSFGPGCDPVADVRQCPTGIHDKQVEPDEVDPVGHNVEESVGTDSAYDLRSRVVLLSTAPPSGWQPGSPMTWRVSAFNDGPALAVSGWTLTLVLPKAGAPVLPSANALRTCAKGTTTAGYPFVRCTGRGPLSPGVTSIAVDVSAVVPVGAAPGSLGVVTYVLPAVGQPAETNPLGTAPLSSTVDTTASPTDNDDSAFIVVQ